MLGHQWTGSWSEGCLVHRVSDKIIKFPSKKVSQRLANGASVLYFLCFRIQEHGGQASRPEKQDAPDLSATFSPATPGAPGKEGRCGPHCCSTLHSKLDLQHNRNPQGSLENSAEKDQWLLSPGWTVWVTTTCVLGSTERACSTWLWGESWENSAQWGLFGEQKCSTPDPTSPYKATLLYQFVTQVWEALCHFCGYRTSSLVGKQQAWLELAYTPHTRELTCLMVIHCVYETNMLLSCHVGFGLFFHSLGWLCWHLSMSVDSHLFQIFTPRPIIYHAIV